MQVNEGEKVMKKVLFTATVDSHILQFHLPFLKLFKDNGYEVHVATNGNEKIPYCDVKHIVSFERSPIKLNNLKAIKQLKKIIENEKFDIIHTHTPMGSVVTRLAANNSRKKNHTRVIYTAHGFHFFKGAPLKNWLIFYPVEKWLAKYTDTLILINKEDYDLAKRKFSRRCKDIQYVPGVGIDEEKFNFEMTDKEKEELRKSFRINKDDFVMIYPAELSKRKRQIWLINSIGELLKEHKDIHLLLPGKDSMNGKCQELVGKLELEEQIHFLGYRNDIPKLLKISDIAVSTASQEGLPVNIMEAMYMGLPIVATDCRGNRDLIENGTNGFLINIEDKTMFLKNIKKIYKNNNFISLGKTKNNYYSFLLKDVIVKMEKIYNKKKYIAYLRSTPIYNDSRATKEIKSYNKFNNKMLIYGWNRENENINFEKLNQTNIIYMYSRKAKFGNGIKNIFNLAMFNLWLIFKIKKDIDKIDIIHACDFDTAFIAKYIAKKYNKKLIYDIYDYYVDCHSLGFLKNIVEKLDIQTINYADIVFICTEKRKEQIKKSKPKKIVVIYNSPRIIDKTNKLIKDDKKIYLGYFGILQDDRLLLEISKEIIKEKDIVLYIGGFGKYEQYFDQLSKKYKNIIFYGTISYKEVLEKEQNCDVLFATYNPLIKNHKYSAPNKVYEAMALNIPIIVCKDTGIDEMVKKDKIGKVIHYDAKEFINEVKKIKDMPRFNISNVFIEKYSWEIMEKKLENCIYKLREG